MEPLFYFKLATFCGKLFVIVFVLKGTPCLILREGSPKNRQALRYHCNAGGFTQLAGCYLRVWSFWGQGSLDYPKQVDQFGGFRFCHFWRKKMKVDGTTVLGAA